MILIFAIMLGHISITPQRGGRTGDRWARWPACAGHTPVVCRYCSSNDKSWVGGFLVSSFITVVDRYPLAVGSAIYNLLVVSGQEENPAALTPGSPSPRNWRHLGAVFTPPPGWCSRIPP